MNGYQLTLEMRRELGDLDARVAAGADNFLRIGLRVQRPS